jgi:RNA recognition motif-containing protein
VLFVGNLSWSITDEQLLAHFQSSGNPLSADVQNSATGRSKGWGLVKYETPEIAQNAIDVLHKSELGGRQINVRMDRK